ncbi:leukocyte receptor cluster member 1 homolog [Zerene cesonia]|uniref:leukocyte receptor cluster member 1 homolog n=1 Tax=Zerene cesonia TaxID=33412 RepID=UPI0018E5437B|nr:leukocyte receptor cluster member 1 homolog [Zerene cesonia]
MNILPKKRWHVRTKENIARVRRDEAEAAEKERQEKRRIDQADRELRLNILKQKSKQKLDNLHTTFPTNDTQEVEAITQEHVNLFADIEHSVSTTNKEHDREVTERKEEYEKKIGYLTYLGQDTNEALGKKNWYEVLPDSSRFCRPDYIKDTYDKLVLKDEDGKPKTKECDVKDGEINWKSKQRHDPINAFKKYCNSEKTHMENKSKNKAVVVTNSKHKKDSSNKSDKEIKLQKLREARLKREQEEKQKTVLFLTKLNGGPTVEDKEKPKKLMPKYNSQFNPELARQNYR